MNERLGPPESDIQKRIMAFISDYAAWEERANSHSVMDTQHLPCPCEIESPADLESIDFAGQDNPRDDSIRIGLERVSQTHCFPADLLLKHGFGYGTERRHDPETESITSIVRQDDCATVKTTKIDGYCRAFEYHLQRLGGSWRIVSILEYHGEDLHAEWPDWAESDFRTKWNPVDDVGIDFGRAFVGGEKAYNSEERACGPMQRVDVGDLYIPSGMLTLADPAYALDARPLAAKLPSSKVRVELMQLLGWNAFARIVLRPGNTASTWVPAHALPHRDEEATAPFAVGTRCGAFVVVDAQDWKNLSSYEAENFCDRMNEMTCGRSRSLFASIPLRPSGRETALVLARGGGDFDCPCYWGIDERGQAVELIVDFSICNESKEEAFEVPLRAEYLDSCSPIAAMTEFGFDVTLFSPDSGRLEIHCEGSCSRFELLDRRNHVLSSSNRFGVMHSGNTFTYSLEAPSVPIESVQLRIVWQSSTHSFARPSDLS